MGLFSAGFPTAVQGRLPHLTERTSFPLPSSGQATRPPGGSTAHLQLIENSTSYSLIATNGRLSRNRQLRLVENSNQHARLQGNKLWESSAFCGKNRFRTGLAASSLPHNHAEIRQTIDEELHCQCHEQQTHDSHQNSNTRFPKKRAHAARPG